MISVSGSLSQVRTLARTDEARGLLWLMEEEAVQPGGSEETLLERLFSYYGSAQGDSKGDTCYFLSAKTSDINSVNGSTWYLCEMLALSESCGEHVSVRN